MGRRTYEKFASMGVPDPPPDNLTYVIIRPPRADSGNIRFHSGDVVEFVRGLEQVRGTGIHRDTGAQLVHPLPAHGLLEEMFIPIIPVLLGDDIRLFGRGLPSPDLTVIESRSFPSGIDQVRYSLR